MIFNREGKDNCLMTDSSIIYRYIHGKNGKVTLVNPNSNKAHSYVFARPADETRFPENTIFVYALHEGHRMYIGLLDGSGLRRTAASMFGEDTEAVKGARYVVNMANRQDLVDRKAMLLYHSGRCCVCGRKLTSAKAMKDGVGKKCLKKLEESLSKVPWDGN